MNAHHWPAGIGRRIVFCFLPVFLLSLISPLTAQPASTQPAPVEIITPDNVSRLQHVKTYGEEGAVGSVARWSPDGRTLAVNGRPGIWLFDAEDLNGEPDLIDFGMWIADLAWSPNGRMIAGGSETMAALWDFGTETLTPLDGAAPVAFSPDGSRLAYVHYLESDTDSNEGVGIWNTSFQVEVQVLDLVSGNIEANYEVPRESVNDIPVLAFSPEGSTLYLTWSFSYGADCGHGGTESGIFAWDLQASTDDSSTPVTPDEFLQQFGEGNLVIDQFAFSPDGQFAVAVNGFDTVVWDRVNQTRLLEPDGGFSGVPFSQDSRLIALAQNRGTVIYEMSTLPEVLEPHTTIPFNGSTDFHPDGSRIAIANTVWDVEKGTRIDAALIDQFAYAGAASYLLQIAPDDEAYTLDPVTGAVIASFEVESDWLLNVHLLPESVLLIDRDLNGTLIHAATGERLAQWTFTSGYPTMSEDRSLLLVPSQDADAAADAFMIVNTRTAETVIPPDFERFIRPYFSADNVLPYVSNGSQLRFWDFETESLLPFMMEWSEGMSVSFEASDRMIVVTDPTTQTAHVWDTVNQTLLPEIPDIGSSNVLTFDLDADRMAYFHVETFTIYVREISTGDLIASKVYEYQVYLDSLTFRGDVIHVRYCSQDTYWNFVTDEEIDADALPRRSVARSYFSTTPDGTVGLSRDEDQVILWHTADDTELTTLQTGGDIIRLARFSSDGRYLIAETMNGTLMVWALPEG